MEIHVFQGMSRPQVSDPQCGLNPEKNYVDRQAHEETAWYCHKLQKRSNPPHRLDVVLWFSHVFTSHLPSQGTSEKKGSRSAQRLPNLACNAMADTALPKRVLFVGNSFTFYWNLPQSVVSMAQSQKINLAAHQSTGSGATLGEHWNGDKELQTLDVLRGGDFDAVVLQEHAMRSIQDPDSTVRHAKLLAEEIKRKKAKIYIFLPWARETWKTSRRFMFCFSQILPHM